MTMAAIRGRHAPGHDHLQNANAAKGRVLSGLSNYASEGR